MSEVEKTPDPVLDETPADNEPTSANEADKGPEETESKTSKDSGDKTTVLDMFKKYASSGPSWADLMVEEAVQNEAAQQKLKEDQIKEALVESKEPFIIYVSNLSPTMTAEHVYYAFGGPERVLDMYLYEGSTGEALVEFKDKHSLVQALMLHEQIHCKKKLNVEYVDALTGKCYTLPRPNYDYKDNNTLPRPKQPEPKVSKVSQHSRPKHEPKFPKAPAPVRPRQNEQKGLRGQPPINLAKSEPKIAPKALPPVAAEKVEPKVPKASPFGLAKPVNTDGKIREFQEKIESECKKPTIQKKQSVSSQHSQQLSEDQSVDEPKQPISEPPKPLAEVVVEPEKKPHSITTVVSSKRNKFQHQRSDYSGSNSRGNHKINVQPVKKFLGMSQKSLVDGGREERKKGDNATQRSETGSTASSNVNSERRYPKRHHDHRKDSSANTHSTHGHKEVQKQSSNETKSKSPPRPEREAVSPVFSSLCEPSTPVADSVVSTPTTNEPAPTESKSDSPAPTVTKSKKSKSNKKKKSNATLNNSMFAVLDEIRE